MASLRSTGDDAPERDALARASRPSALAAKLSPPASPPSPVLRAALADRLAAAETVRLVVVRAPAGFGKTTAMLQFRDRLEAQGLKTAWLTLDAADNDVTRFLAGFGAAVRAFGPELPALATPLEAVESLYASSAPWAVFLDDFELVREPAVLALLRAAIERLPRGCRLVIGSRSLPDLGLARLRAHGQLLEIDAEALRFDLAETEQYLRQRGQAGLSLNALDRLHRKTEGWVAALWLASLALERQGGGSEWIERFSGSTRALADYLADDVLAHQPAELRDFLLLTSVLQRLDAPICQALVPGVDAQRVLRLLDEQGLFLATRPGDEGGYRYHGLFADFLRERLRRERPDEVAQLHRAASAWHEAQGQAVPAIDHAIAGGDAGRALALLDTHAQRFLEQGRTRLLERWLAAIAPAALQAHPVLESVSIWATLLTHGGARAAVALEASGGRRSADAQVQAHVNAQWPLILAMQDRYDEAHAEGQASLARLPTGNAFADSVLCNAMANVFTVMGERRAAQRLIDSARRVHGEGVFNRMYAETQEGMLDLQQGRLREAMAHFRTAVAATSKASYNYTSGNAWAGVLYAGALYEIDQFDQAEHVVGVYLPLACDVGVPDHIITGHMIRVRVAFYRGDVGRAFETLTALEYLGHHLQLRRVVASAKLERGRLLLLQGHAQAAHEEFDRADDPEVWPRARRQWLPAHAIDYIELARLRWQIHFGDARGTLAPLEAEVAEATRQSRHRRALRLRVLHALALQRSGEPAAATDVIAGVLRLASQEGFVRVIADEGEAVGRLVQRFHAVVQEAPAKGSDPVLLAYLPRLLAAFGTLAEGSAAASSADRLMEPLTRKEIQVLQCVAAGGSNSAIAEQLELSVSTVRTHLRSVSAKLGAHNRAEAVAIARRLDLIR